MSLAHAPGSVFHGSHAAHSLQFLVDNLLELPALLSVELIEPAGL